MSKGEGHMKNKEACYFANIFIILWCALNLKLKVLNMSDTLVFNSESTSFVLPLTEI